MKKNVFFLLISCLSFTLLSCSNSQSGESHEAINKYQVTFDSLGGSKVDSLLTNRIDEMPISNKMGYSLKGWYLDKEDQLINYPYEVVKDQKLTASWNYEKFNVSFDCDGGEPLETIEHVDELTSCPLTTKDGYNLLGWHLKDDIELISFPFKFSEDLTLYASWERLPITPNGKYLAKAEVNAMPAKSYWSVEYQQSSLFIHVEVSDEFLYGYETNPGLNDNVEVILAHELWTQASGLNASNSYHFLTDINGNGYYNYSIGLSQWSEAEPFPSGSTSSVRKTSVTADGFKGYIVDFNISYSLIGLTYTEALGHISMTVGMRNTNSHTASEWGHAFDNDYLSSWSYYLLDENNQIVKGHKKPSTLLIGDSNFSCDNWTSINADLTSYNAFCYSEDIELDEWIERIDNLLDYGADKIILNVGRFDYHEGELSNSEISNKIEQLLEICKEKYPANKIYFTSLEPFKNYETRLEDLSNLNTSLATICVDLGINFIDTYSLFTDGGELDKTLFKNNFNFSSSGFTSYFNLLKAYL